MKSVRDLVHLITVGPSFLSMIEFLKMIMRSNILEFMLIE